MARKREFKRHNDNPAGLVFVGCMFIGGGIGFIFGNIPAVGAIERESVLY